MKPRKSKISSVAALVLFLLFPMRYEMDDGGSVEYRAALYSVTKHHCFAPGSPIEEPQYIDGWRVKILGFEVFNSFSPAFEESLASWKDLH